MVKLREKKINRKKKMVKDTSTWKTERKKKGLDEGKSKHSENQG